MLLVRLHGSLGPDGARATDVVPCLRMRLMPVLDTQWLSGSPTQC